MKGELLLIEPMILVVMTGNYKIVSEVTKPDIVLIVSRGFPQERIAQGENSCTTEEHFKNWRS